MNRLKWGNMEHEKTEMELKVQKKCEREKEKTELG